MTFFVVLPLTQEMVFLATTGLGVIALPVKTIVALADTGASVAVVALGRCAQSEGPTHTL